MHILHDSKVEDVSFFLFPLGNPRQNIIKKISFDEKVNQRFCPKINPLTKFTSTMTKTQVP
jgi:hypothetical protein